MTTVCFVVIGERRDNPSVLLLRGDDGHDYAYDLTTDHITAIAFEDVAHFTVTTPPAALLGPLPFTATRPA